ncbi:MAG: cell division protein FtsZ [Opitutales bacterium]
MDENKTEQDQAHLQEGEAGEVKIKIIGVGGAGVNVVDGLMLDGLQGVTRTVINTDAKVLGDSSDTEKFVLGRSVTRGLGAGGEIELARQAAEADREALARLVEGFDLILLVSGLGGGTGSAAAPLIAEVAAKTDALVLAFVSLPFSFEGARRKSLADDGVGELRKLVHGLVSLPNDVLLQEGEDTDSVFESFAVANRWIARGVYALCSMLLKTGLINQDLNSLRHVFHGRGGKTIFGTGRAEGEGRMERALEELFLCPLLHVNERPSKLDHILVHVAGGEELGITEINDLMSEVSKRFDSRDDIVFGAVIEEGRRDSVELTLLAKTEMERKSPVGKAGAPDKKANTERSKSEGGLKIEPEIAQNDKPPGPVHQTKLKEKNRKNPSQEEFSFVEKDEERGYFEKTERNLYRDEDLDVPTYLRRGVRIKLKV